MVIKLSTCIYDWRNDRRRAHPYTWFLILILGIIFLVEFFGGIGETVQKDIHNFPPLWHSTPLLALVLAALKLSAYLLGISIIALMIFVPCRNFFFPRIILGQMETTTTVFDDKGKSRLLVKMEHRDFHVSNLVDVKSIVENSALEGQNLRFTLGAFNRVLKIDKLL
jgi:hypothetical protein